VDSELATVSGTADIILMIDCVCNAANFTNGLYDAYEVQSLAAKYSAILVDERAILGSSFAAANGAGPDV
jgi:hypothetical protein